MKEHTYDTRSWHMVTIAIKEALNTDSLTSAQCKRIMQWYVVGTPTGDIIKNMKGE